MSEVIKDKLSIVSRTIVSIVAAVLYSYSYAWFQKDFPVCTHSLSESKQFIVFTIALLFVFFLIATIAQNMRMMIKLKTYVQYPFVAILSSILIWLNWDKLLAMKKAGDQFTILFISAGPLGMAIPVAFLIGISMLVIGVIIRV